MKEPKCYLSEYPRMEATAEFIERNNLTLERTVSEIQDRMRDAQASFLDFSSEVYPKFLSVEDSREFFKEEYFDKVASGELEIPPIPSLEEAAQDFLDYMNFAWGKAEDERGISATRSVQKLGAYLWLFGRDDLRRLIDDDELYNPYGAPALIAVCEEMDIDVPDSLREFAKHRCAV